MCGYEYFRIELKNYVYFRGSKMESNCYYYQINNLLVDLKLGVLISNDKLITLPKLSRNVLSCLLKKSPQVVTQDELIHEAWHKLEVSDENLQQRIKLVRKALGDNSIDKNCIITVRGIGYKLVGEVKQLNSNQYNSLKLEYERNSASSNQSYLSSFSSYFYSYKLKVCVFVSIGCVSIFSAFLFINIYTGTPYKILLAQDIIVPNDHLITSVKLYNQGLKYYGRYSAKDNKIAINLFKKAIEVAPNYAQAYAGLANAYLQGVYQFNFPKSQIDLTLSLIEQGIKINPNIAALFKAKGFAYALKGFYHKSIVAYHQAIRIDPNYTDAITNLAYNYRELGMLGEAIFWHEKAILILPNSTSGYQHLAQTYAYLNMHQEAEYWFNKVMILKPDYALAKVFYCHYLISTGRFKEAILIGKNILEQQPSYIKANNIIADALYFSGQYKKAISYYLQAGKSVGKTKDYADLRLNMIYAQMNNKSNASIKLRRLLVNYLDRVKAKDEDPEILIKIASIYAIEKEYSLANIWLKKAVDGGWIKYSLTLKDPAFTNIRDTQEFKSTTLKMLKKVELMQQNIKSRSNKIKVNQSDTI
jgi:DNA-binding winged helix-turn-helix (wHTH) protein/Tfp pilus assembly protein PilF